MRHDPALAPHSRRPRSAFTMRWLFPLPVQNTADMLEILTPIGHARSEDGPRRPRAHSVMRCSPKVPGSARPGRTVGCRRAVIHGPGPAFRAGPACDGQPAGTACWMALADRPGCFAKGALWEGVWVNRRRRNRKRLNRNELCAPFDPHRRHYSPVSAVAGRRRRARRPPACDRLPLPPHMRSEGQCTAVVS